jgi:uridylate kinase
MGGGAFAGGTGGAFVATAGGGAVTAADGDADVWVALTLGVASLGVNDPAEPQAANAIDRLMAVMASAKDRIADMAFPLVSPRGTLASSGGNAIREASGSDFAVTFQ